MATSSAVLGSDVRPPEAARLRGTASAPRLCPRVRLLAHPAHVRGTAEGSGELLVGLLPLVRSVASRMRARLPSQVEFDDLVQEGALGLLDAVHKFDVSRHVKFDTYACHRIRGAILDGLRALDPAPRDLRRKIRKIDKMYEKLQGHLGRPVSDEEVSRAMNMNLRDWYRTVRELAGAGGEGWPLSRPARFAEPGPALEELSVAGPQDDPFERCYHREQRETLGRVLARLPDRQRRVITLYYYRQLTMKEIGARLGVDESRISQLHSSALRFLKAQVERTIQSVKPPVPLHLQAAHPLFA